ncbi:hypothetical protein [Microcoleus sp. OTE_8_concoct_300]|uniref:hypothetical protein n=1 Tax=Microcoleus sp. OTE_8_concoct_300 TaxID=2964710 RepID=UPI00403F57D9
MPPAISPSSQVRRAPAAVGRKCGWDFSYPQLVYRGFDTISLAHSIPVVCKSSFKIDSLLKPRNPQLKSPAGLEKNSCPIHVSAGFPKYLCSGGIAPGLMPPQP